AKDDTAGKTPLPGSSPPKYPFTLTVPAGHQYTIQFIVNEGTPTEKVVSLHQGAINIFSFVSAGMLDLGFVDTSGTNAAADNNILTQSGVISGGTTGDNTIKLEGYRYVTYLNDSAGSVKTRFQVEIRNPSGTSPVTDTALVKGVAFFDNAWNAYPLSGNYLLYNGSDVQMDTTGVIASRPLAEIQGILQAAPSSLAEGFYNVVVTDNAGNLHKAKVYYRQPDTVAKASNLAQVINADNSITLTWTNPTFPGGKQYGSWLHVTCNDGNGDGVSDALLIVQKIPPVGTYTIPADNVAAYLAGKSGLTWHVQIRQYDDKIVFPDGTSLGTGTQFYRNISAVTTLTLPTASVAFTQADLTGTWDVLQFQTGTAAGWIRAVAAFNASGNMTSVTNYLDSDGSTSPGPLTVVWTVSSAGVVSETDGGVSTGFHARMSSDKKLVVGIMGLDNNWTSVLTVARKRTGIAFTNADLANKTFTFHQLNSGTDNTWTYGAGTSDGSGLATITSEVGPSGPHTPGSGGTFSVSSTGIVTISGDTTWYGLMTDDRKVIFYINTSPSSTAYSFGVINITGQTYIQADLAGVSYFNSLTSATLVKPGWAYGSTSMDNVGTGTYLTYEDSAGGVTPGPFTRAMDSAGVVTTTDPTPSMYNGQLSYNKNLTVRTGTNASGRHQLVIGIK
ncbi:MAG TPA: hypothetical protein VN450_04715, partial [Candidatus Methylomirabilis sp.]|nr:hypothetical protein [Candidatus Methylomirabilis sp.]